MTAVKNTIKMQVTRGLRRTPRATTAIMSYTETSIKGTIVSMSANRHERCRARAPFQYAQFSSQQLKSNLQNDLLYETHNMKFSCRDIASFTFYVRHSLVPVLFWMVMVRPKSPKLNVCIAVESILRFSLVQPFSFQYSCNTEIIEVLQSMACSS